MQSVGTTVVNRAATCYNLYYASQGLRETYVGFESPTASEVTMEKQYCKKCEKMVFWKDVPTVTMPSGNTYRLGCPGGNSPHFCERTGTSIHDDVECKCLEHK